VTHREAHERAADGHATPPKRRRSRITCDRWLVPVTAAPSQQYLNYADSRERWINERRAAEALRAPGGVLRRCPNIYCGRLSIHARCPDCQAVMVGAE
jgi:hypothetical protein